jgi:hypothetical protein
MLKKSAFHSFRENFNYFTIFTSKDKHVKPLNSILHRTVPFDDQNRGRAGGGMRNKLKLNKNIML